MKRAVAVDLFCGAGGLSIGIQKAGFHIVLANDIEKDFVDTYRLNHVAPRVIQGDIHAIDFREELNRCEAGRIDLLCGGPPCQGFSTVGKKDRQDPRNTLLMEFIRAAAEMNPRYLLFENVSGFIKLYDGSAHHLLLKELCRLGYQHRTAALEASDYGLPQRRQRTIVLAWKMGEQAVEFPEPTHGDGNDLFGLKTKLCLMDAISDLPEIGCGQSAEAYAGEPGNDYQRALRAKSKVLTEHNAANYGVRMQAILALVPPGGSVMDLPLELRPEKYFKNTYARLLPDEPSPTVTRNFGTPSSSRCIHPFQNRALSTREGARLQGFPDDYIFAGAKTSKNLQIGNAVPPIFGEIIAREIIKVLSRGEKAYSVTA